MVKSVTIVLSVLILSWCFMAAAEEPNTEDDSVAELKRQCTEWAQQDDVPANEITAYIDECVAASQE